MKKNQILIVASVIIFFLLGIYILVVQVTAPIDENVEKYANKISEINAKNFLHVEQTCETIVEGNIKKEEFVEVYVSGDAYARLTKEKLCTWKTEVSLKEVRSLDDTLHTVYIDEAGAIQTNIMSGMSWLPYELTLLNKSYLFLDYNNVIYEEAQDQYIVTYDNRSMIGNRVGGDYPESNFKSAKSISYFDKEWNLMRMDVIESFDVENETGLKEYTRKMTIVFHDTSQEEIDKKIEEEYISILSYFEEK